MKTILPIFFTLLIIVGCSTGKEVSLDKNPLLVINNPYWQEIVPGQEDGQKSLVLVLPYSFPIENYAIDSVYFKGYHEKLDKRTMEGATVYALRIFTKNERLAIPTPVAIDENQALVSYVDLKKKKHYFKVSDIEKREPIIMP